MKHTRDVTVTEVEFKFKRSSIYTKGLGIFKTLPEDDITYEGPKLDCIVIPYVDLLTRKSPQTFHSSEMYALHILDKKKMAQSTFRVSEELADVQAVADLMLMED